MGEQRIQRCSRTVHLPFDFANAGVAEVQAPIQQTWGRGRSSTFLTSPGVPTFPLRVYTSNSKGGYTQAREESTGPPPCHPGAARTGQSKDKALKSRTEPFKRRGGNPVPYFRTPHCLLKQITFYPYHVWLQQSRREMCTIFCKWVLGCCR